VGGGIDFDRNFVPLAGTTCPPTCDDGFLKQDETRVDCGGACCNTCPTCDDNDWDLHLVDDYADGWEGNTISVSDCDGNVLDDGH
jgi:hypothetical protein